MTLQRKITLPGGYLLDDGSVTRTCVIQEMTGKTQSLMGRKDLQSKPHELTAQILQDCVVSLSGSDSPSKSHFEDLLAGDRDYIIFEIRRLSLGDKYTHEFTCSNTACGVHLFEELNLESDIEIWDLPDLIDSRSNVTTETIPVYGADTLTRVWTFNDGDEGKMSASGRYLTCRDVSTGTDSKENNIQTLHNLLSRVITKCTVDDEVHTGPFSLDWINSQPYRVIEFLEGCIGIQQCGPNLSIKADCDQCGTLTESTLDMGNFFVSSMTVRGRASMLTQRSGSSAR